MSRKKEKRTPAIRFPEFRNAEEWKEPELGTMVEFIDERAGSNAYTTMSITSGVGLISQREKFGREISGNQYRNYFVIRKWDFAYNKSATKQYPEGYIAMLKDIAVAAVPNSIFTCFKVDTEQVYPDFLNFVFHNNFHGKWLRKFIEVGARAHGSLNIDNNVLCKMPVFLPSVKEQKKIADCLSSLDELITEENRKLKALQQHKKGLMQQIFPAEGEKVPKLRFKEFIDSGEWITKSLGELVEIKSGSSPSNYNLKRKGAYPFLKVEDLNNCNKYQITSREYSDENEGIVPRGSVIFPKRGASILLNKVRISVNETIIDSNLMAITPNAQIEDQFLYYKILSEGLFKIADTSSIPQINNKHIIPYAISIPAIHEQKRISDCLSSIDTLITAQSQNVESRKIQRKALMQQLFPKVSEIEA